MRILLPPLEIGDREGFTQDKDIFGRASIGRGLTNLIRNVTDPTVIAVDGQWGSGKTTFLKMWAGELRKAGFPVVYFDAFQHDYSWYPAGGIICARHLSFYQSSRPRSGSDR